MGEKCQHKILVAFYDGSKFAYQFMCLLFEEEQMEKPQKIYFHLIQNYYCERLVRTAQPWKKKSLKIRFLLYCRPNIVNSSHMPDACSSHCHRIFLARSHQNWWFVWFFFLLSMCPAIHLYFQPIFNANQIFIPNQLYLDVTLLNRCWPIKAFDL